MTTNEPYGIDPASLPPELLADIDEVLNYWAGEFRQKASGSVGRLRQLVTPPPPPECGWQPEGVVETVKYLKGHTFSVSVANGLLAKVRCTLPAGHHKGRISRDEPCCDGDDHDQIHAGDEHRIENWVKP